MPGKTKAKKDQEVAERTEQRLTEHQQAAQRGTETRRRNPQSAEQAAEPNPVASPSQQHTLTPQG
jgi:hypothetical protein